jgi:hypothetical protein
VSPGDRWILTFLMGLATGIFGTIAVQMMLASDGIHRLGL